MTTGSPARASFRAIATLADGTTSDISKSVAWGSNAPQVGGVDAGGLYTATGALGGLVSITASVAGRAGAAALTVELKLPVTGVGVPPGAAGPLQGATTQDPTVLAALPLRRDDLSSRDRRGEAHVAEWVDA